MIEIAPKQKPEILKVEPIRHSPLFEMEKVSLRFSNQAKRDFFRVHSLIPSAVLTIPVLDNEHFLLIREYGVGIEEYSLGFPKGALQDNEDILAGANRELMEEVGYGAKQLRLLKTFSTSPSYMSARMHIVLARELYEKRLPGDEPEPIDVVPWRFDQIDQLLQREDFHEARSVAALLMLERLHHAC